MPTSTQLRREHEAWARRRTVRIDRLCAFTSHCAHLADTPDDWYSQHVVWALNRLVALGYQFPELDRGLERFRLIQGEVIAA